MNAFRILPFRRAIKRLAAAFVLTLSCAGLAAQNVNICDRTEVIRAKILDETPTVGDACDAVLASELAGITILEMRGGAGIDFLREDDFSGLSSLQTLSIISHPFAAALPADIFSELSNLRTLNLIGSFLTGLPADVFSELSNLRTLNLFNNEFSALPATVFSGLTELRDLRLDSNELSTLPATVFSDLGNLQTLDLSNNEFSTLPAGVFSELTNLQTLRLSRNDLSTLPATVFSGLMNLRSLNLRFNKLPTLPAGVFSELTNLRTLDLFANGLSTLPATAFSGLTNLQNLDLFSNRLSTLPATAFSDLGKLMTLNLFDNEFSELPADVFSELTNLQRLRLDSNELSTLPAGVFSELTNLQRLSLSDNPGADFRLEVRPRFSLSPLPDSFTSATVKLTLIEGAPRATTVSLVVTGAELSSNFLTIPVGGVESDGAVEITRTSGSFDLVLVAPPELGGRSDDYSGFDIVVAEGESAVNICGRTPQVQTAILDETPAADVCEIVLVSGLTAIAELDLAGAGIASLQTNDFARLTGLRGLDLGNNGLSGLPPGVFSGLTGLRRLDLGNNGLSELPPGVFSGLAGLEAVNLSDNPGATFTLTVEAEFAPSPLPDDFAAAMVKLTLREGAPRAVTVRLVVTGAELSSDSLTIPAGGTESTDMIEVTRTSNNFELTLGLFKLGGADDQYTGFTIVPAAPVRRAVPTVDICDRTLEVQTAILAETPADDTCDEVPEAELTAITSLDLFEVGIMSLQAGDFSTLTSLRTLDLEGNSFPELPANIFLGLSSLQTLNLSFVNLSGLPAGVFSGLRSLQRLELDNNSLSELPANIFLGLSSLRVLDLRETRLSELPAGVFSGLSSLRELFLSFNSLSELPANIFSGLSSLRELSLHDNDLSTLPAGVFSGLTNLVAVDLLRNSVEPFLLMVRPEFVPSLLPKDFVGAMVKLTLREGAPRRTTVSLSATGATLSGDSLTIPTGSTESGVIEITRTAGDFELTLGSFTFGGNNDDYGGLDIVAGEAITNICDRTAQVQTAILAETPAAETCDVVSVSELTASTKLYLSSSGIRSLRTGDFSGLSSLQRLDLSDNHLLALPAAIFSGLTGLTELDLSGNPGLDFSLTVRPEFIPSPLPDEFTSATVKLTLREGAPRAVTVRLVVTGAELSSNSLTIPAGGTESTGAVEITRTSGPFDLALVAPPELGGRNDDYDGFDIIVAGGESAVDICDRTAEVRSEILRVTPANDSCDTVLASELAATTKLDLTGDGIESLQAGDFSGLSGLQELLLSSNSLSALPAGVFSGLSSLRRLQLSDNPGADFRLEVRLRFALSSLPDSFTNSTLRLALNEGAPRRITVGLSATGAALSGNFLTIPAGGVESIDVVEVIRTSGDFELALSLLELGGEDNQYEGVMIVSTASVMIGAPEMIDICARPDALQTAILDKTPTPNDSCDAVLVSELAATTELDLSGDGIGSLQAGDFSWLSGLQTLRLDGNDLSELPPGIFSGLNGLRTLDLGSNDLSALPAGVFSGLTDLEAVDLSDNPVTTFTLTVEAEFTPSPLPDDFASAMVRLIMREGAPRATTVSLVVTGAELSSNSLTIPAGSTESTDMIEITRTSDGFELIFVLLELGGEDSDYPGITIVPPAPVTISSGVRLRLRVFLEGALE